MRMNLTNNYLLLVNYLSLFQQSEDLDKNWNFRQRLLLQFDHITSDSITRMRLSIVNDIRNNWGESFQTFSNLQEYL